jgi:hypothetical protein
MPRIFFISGRLAVQLRFCSSLRTLIWGQLVYLRNLLPRISRCDELCCRYPYLVPLYAKIQFVLCFC